MNPNLVMLLVGLYLLPCVPLFWLPMIPEKLRGGTPLRTTASYLLYDRAFHRYAMLFIILTAVWPLTLLAVTTESRVHRRWRRG